jgi:hypothetical protein
MFANHIGAENGDHEIQRTNNGLLYIVGLNTAQQAVGSGTGGQDDVLTLALNNFPLPKRSIEVIEVPYLNEVRKFPGRATYDDLTVVFNDYVDRPVAAILWKWNYLVHNPETGRTGMASALKKSGWVSLFSPDGQIERQYRLVGLWPNMTDPGEIDFSGADALRINLTLSIDKAIPGRGLAPAGNR